MRRLCLLLLLAGVSAAQSPPTVRVRLYHAHPPEELEIVSAASPVRWRSCDRCPERSDKWLQLRAKAGAISVNGDDFKVVVIASAARINAAASFTSQWPLRISAKGDRLWLIAELPLEDYVTAVLAGESGGFQNDEAMKAMAVTARTYAVKFRPRHEGDGFDFCDTTHCQDLRVAVTNRRARQAAEATRGELLWHRGSLAATYYHQDCGGRTAAAREVWPDVREPYLDSKPDAYCVRGDPLRWETALSREELERALAHSEISLPSGWSSVEIASRTASGRAQRLRFLLANGRDFPLSASTLRFAVGRALGWNRIRSDLFDVAMGGEKVVFRGRGAGHGVGMCQAGAHQMAREGKSYREILSFYFPGTIIGASAVGFEWKKQASERFDLLSEEPARDVAVLDIAERELASLEKHIGWKLTARPELRIFSTLDEYRNATGEPGWVAASTRGRVIRLQPVGALLAKNILESTLRHELAHLLVEGRAKRGTPLWFREGLTLYLSSSESSIVAMPIAEIERTLTQSQDSEQVRRAYRAAAAKVKQLIDQHSEDAVLAWLTDGLPPI
jgi:stage II sporulation protein D